MKKEKSYKKKNEIIDKRYLSVGLIGIIVTFISFFFDKIAIRLINLITFPTMNYIFITITTLGETYIFILIAMILAISLIMYHKPIMAFILSIASAFSVQWLLKIIIERPRPFEVGLTSAGIAANSSSFPSGHAIMFFAIIPVIEKKFPKVKILFWIIAILVGFSRIYLGVHYLSDVIAGAFLGYMIGWLFIRIEDRYRWNI